MIDFDDSGPMDLNDDDLIMAIYWSDIFNACAVEFTPGLMHPRTVEERKRAQEVIVAAMQCMEQALVRLDGQLVEVRSDAELLH